MYEYKFFNPPPLISAMNELGSNGLFDFLLPHHQDFIVIFGEAEMKAIRKLFVERTANLFGPKLRMDALYRNIENWQEGSLSEAELGDPDKFQRLDRFFKYLATHVWMADNQPEEAIRQVKAMEFDVEALRRKHLAVLFRDPVYVADQFVIRIVRARGMEDRVKDLVRMSMGRIAIKESRRDIDWCRRQNGLQINHIVDWLISAIATDAPWLSNVDELGRPRKLMKTGSIDALYAEAEKQMQKKLSRERAGLGVEDEQDFAVDRGEFRIVRLKTPKALDCESNAMRHCIGHGAYDRLLDQDEHLLLSLRDAYNVPHATIEVRAGKIVQFHGKANSTPKDSYRQAVERLLSPLGIEFMPPVPLLENPCAEIEIDAGVPALARAYGLDGVLRAAGDAMLYVDQNQQIWLI